jgi:hypothetical protein
MVLYSSNLPIYFNMTVNLGNAFGYFYICIDTAMKTGDGNGVVYVRHPVAWACPAIGPTCQS